MAGQWGEKSPSCALDNRDGFTVNNVYGIIHKLRKYLALSRSRLQPPTLSPPFPIIPWSPVLHNLWTILKSQTLTIWHSAQFCEKKKITELTLIFSQAEKLKNCKIKRLKLMLNVLVKVVEKMGVRVVPKLVVSYKVQIWYTIYRVSTQSP